MTKNNLTIFFFLSLLPFLSFSEEKGSANYLSPEKVVESTFKHFPEVLQAIDEIESSKMKVQSSVGSFDMKLKAKADKRLDGYYDGEAVDVVIEKPFQFMNSSLYTGYKVSEGDFPSYEQKAQTLNDGELRAGLKFSLLQDRAIDSRRLKIYESEVSVTNKEQKLVVTKAKIQEKALKAYWTWVAKGNVFQVYEGLVNIAIKRNSALVKKIKRGEVARIYQVENQQYILKRKTQMLEADKEFKEAAFNLSLFYRNDDGNPIIPDVSVMPKKINGEKELSKSVLEASINQTLKQSPKLAIMENEIKKFEFNEEFGENLLLPKLDVKFEVSQDNGVGSKSLEGTEKRVSLDLTIPLERNKGKGIASENRIKKRIVNHYRKLENDTIRVNLNKLFVQLNTAFKKIENTAKEVEYATLLEKSEIKRFNGGDSDFFVVNLREQNTADAKIKNIKAHLEYKKALATFESTRFSLLQ